MAAKKQARIHLLALFFTISLTIGSSEAVECVGTGGIAVYWGQHTEEGTLRDACATHNYQYVVLNGLDIFEDGTVDLNLAGHCGGSIPCTSLESDIQYCQSQGIKVFLNIHHATKPNVSPLGSTVSDEAAAVKLAEYLLENFLSNNYGPLGSVALDGIDIADVPDGPKLEWDEIVIAINASTTGRRIYISAAPQCVYPDQNLNKAIKTDHIDYIWVEFFYYNPCIYKDGDPTNLLTAWNEWTTNVTNSLIFLGLPASNGIEAGYIEPENLKSKILPTIKKSSNYGGVMLWDRYEDQLNDPSYSDQIKDSVKKDCRCVCDDDSASSSFYGLPGGSLPL